ncbi:MAG: right-handed parallel beta-helix repeat-containing protein [Cyanobacteria bacterium P01_D01_bin.123]
MLEAFFAAVDITNLPQEILTANPSISSAVADDGIDDVAAIQAVVDWLTAQRQAGFTDESTIYFPAGVFDLSKTIEVDTPAISFEGAGIDRTILRNTDAFHVGTTGLPDSGVDLKSVNQNAYLFSLKRNADGVAFANVTLIGPGVHGAIFGYGVDELEIGHVEFDNFAWSAVRLFNVSRANIHHNVFIDAGGQAQGTSGVTGGAIYATFLKDSEIHHNTISKSGEREGNVYGIKGRKFNNTHLHHNTIATSFAIELPFESDRFVEIERNYLDGAISIPKFGGGAVPQDGFTFHIHHNYFTRSYSLEWARNGAEVDHNVFVFDTESDGGNLISNFGSELAAGPTKFHNNLILNPGRGIFWSRGVYNNFSFYNNVVTANETLTPRTEGLFAFNSSTDFSTIELRDNIVEVNGASRPLMRNDASYSAVIENNTLKNVSDIDQFDNPDTGSQRGLTAPLVFKVGANEEFVVDGFNLRKLQ